MTIDSKAVLSNEELHEVNGGGIGAAIAATLFLGPAVGLGAFNQYQSLKREHVGVEHHNNFS